MTHAGTAFLALWNDVDPARDAEYNAWHTHEHVPERVGISGILAGRRYQACERRTHRYFTLYDLADAAVLGSPAYLDVIAHPTPWSSSMRPSLRNFFRLPCRVLARSGCGRGAGVATFRFVADPTARSLPAAWVEGIMHDAAIVSIMLGRAEASVEFPLRNTAVDGHGAAAPDHAVVIEGLERAALDALAPDVARVLRKRSGAGSVQWESYDFAFACDRGDLRDPELARQRPRDDLRREFG